MSTVPAAIDACSASIQYTGQPKYTCARPHGHSGPHRADTPTTPVIWTATFAPVPPVVIGR